LREINDALTGPPETRIDKLERQNQEILERLKGLQDDVDRLKSFNTARQPPSLS